MNSTFFSLYMLLFWVQVLRSISVQFKLITTTWGSLIVGLGQHNNWDFYYQCFSFSFFFPSKPGASYCENRHCKAGVPFPFLYLHVYCILLFSLFQSLHASCVDWVLEWGWKSNSFTKHLRQTHLTKGPAWIKKGGPVARKYLKDHLFLRG